MQGTYSITVIILNYTAEMENKGWQGNRNEFNEKFLSN